MDTLVRALAMAVLSAGGACAEGFVVSDLGDVEFAGLAEEALDGSAEPARVVYLLSEAPPLAIEVKLEDADPGLEGRVRSGETTMADLRALCDRNAAEMGSECLELEAAPLRGAVGWRTRTRSDLEMTTRVLVDGPDRLMLTAIGADRGQVDALAERALAVLAPQIIAP
jgi:hypothetical protein